MVDGIRKFAGPAQTRHLVLRGESLMADESAVTRGLFRRAGFNPKYLAPGLSLEVLPPEDFSKLCRISGLDGREVRGACLSASKELEEAVVLGELEAIPCPRMIAFPCEPTWTDLRHELAHDILLGGTISPKERNNFIHLAMLQAYQYLNFTPLGPIVAFLRTVARSCCFPLNLNTIQHMADDNGLSLDHHIYAGELFAYSAEKILEGGSEQAAVPRKIRYYFERIKLFSRG